LNPNGVFFGPTASVNVNALIASGLNLKTKDFMAGKYKFEAPVDAEGGMVVNQGMLQAATGGAVTLIGGAVHNEGMIFAQAGQVNLIAGRQVTMDFDGDGLIRFAIDEEVLQNAHALDDAISNSGEIEADGGAVLLHGKAARDVFSNVVNNDGVIKAGRIENKGGQIKLIAAGPGAALINTGTLDAAGTNGAGGAIEIYAEGSTLIAGQGRVDVASASGEGGLIHILADNKVGLLDRATLIASGATGGGTVLIGGDYQGKNPDIKNAQRTAVDTKVSISADALTQGDGGKVIIWADAATQYYGEISATGGQVSGDGGFVEISGQVALAGKFAGRVDTTATNGNTGTLLLDPENITIASGTADSGDDNDLLDDSFITPGNPIGTLLEAAMPATFTLHESELEGIAATTNIILEASNNISEPIPMAMVAVLSAWT